MLRVDIRDLQRGPVRTEGTLDPHDPVFEGLALGLVEPVTVTGQLQATGEGEYLWRGHVHGVVRGECRRCLTDVLDDVDIDVDAAVFSTDPDAADDPDFYPLAERATSVDVTEVVREELALAAQADLLLCRDDCAGLCPKCGADLNAGPCGCGTAPAEPV
ncbi:MAG TPA: YceD family protein [Gemmatimonadales bacterium]|nr:YceD family protein [Gemmatimonadales bacterium]